MGTRLDYRADIDGLRGVAVLAVLAYHYGLPVPGGFAGVDIFFVISGYLITSIIRADLLAGKFSFSAFVERRIRRIVPALMVMLVVTLAAGFFLLWPKDYESAGMSALLASIGLSNFFFWQFTGYFDLAAELQPYLHTWSLGVEEQFYVLWPIFIAVLWRWRRLLVAAIASGAIISFALSIWGSYRHPEAAFYLLPPRAWELALGGLIAFAPALRIPPLARVLGIALAVGGLFVTDNPQPIPGALLLPCAGAALILLPNASPSWSDRLLNPLAAIGRVSYSLYLWHWPVLVLYRHYQFGAFPSPVELAALAVVSFGLAILSWRFIELPFRKSSSSRRQVFARGAMMAGTAAALAGIVALSSGAAWRLTPDQARRMDRDAMWAWACPQTVTLDGSEYCALGHDWTTATKHAAVFGDSHADHLLPLLDDLYRDTDLAFVKVGSCAPIAGGMASVVVQNAPQYADRCRASWSTVVSLLRGHPEIGLVVLSAAWKGRFRTIYPEVDGKFPTKLDVARAALDEVIEAVSDDEQRKIVIVSDSPPLAVSQLCTIASGSMIWRASCNASRGWTRESFAQSYGESEAVLLQAAERSKATLVQPAIGLCSHGACVTDIDGTAIYRDDHFRRDLNPDLNERLGIMIGLDDLAKDYPARARLERIDF